MLNKFLTMAFISLLTITTLSADVKVCKLDKNLEKAIVKTEGHYKKGYGYPYIIRFNNIEDANAVRTVFSDGWLDKYVIDCKDKSSCIELTQVLVANGITNVDLGVFQMNYYWHKHDFSVYFDYEKQKNEVCKLFVDLSSKFGWSEKTIGKYHSYRDKQSLAYAEKVLNIYKRLESE